MHLAQAARAAAALAGRPFVTPDDVAALAPVVLAHRLVPVARGLGGRGRGHRPRDRRPHRRRHRGALHRHARPVLMADQRPLAGRRARRTGATRSVLSRYGRRGLGMLRRTPFPPPDAPRLDRDGGRHRPRPRRTGDVDERRRDRRAAPRRPRRARRRDRTRRGGAAPGLPVGTSRGRAGRRGLPGAGDAPRLRHAVRTTVDAARHRAARRPVRQHGGADVAPGRRAGDAAGRARRRGPRDLPGARPGRPGDGPCRGPLRPAADRPARRVRGGGRRRARVRPARGARLRSARRGRVRRRGAGRAGRVRRRQ
ncbi:hypothetical protein [Curtobacterium sp. MCJR17_043]|uniref:hypothetical protein n=1 Tax=Curtobacterium sp. MCJR17_043 TaxID=2175660 RepID=UPI0024DFD6C0|nr:hypothetical protein [Curtobacterium sp. MCJR17_043]WIB37084.1 hypothetical protein DEJ15_15335 [Curtobacterium sp. MCJR17_043]